ncbi:MAG: phosphohistidine phosphatase SixA [bacterium]
MKLYLIRHAQPKNQLEDPLQHLSDSGRKSMKKVSEYAARLELFIAEIWHSEKLRAKETAEIFAQSLGLTQKVKERTGLSPGDDVTPIESWLMGKEENIALVGHLPFLDKLASLLLCGSEDASLINFTMGSIACLSRDVSGEWTLDWIITPDLIPDNTAFSG